VGLHSQVKKLQIMKTSFLAIIVSFGILSGVFANDDSVKADLTKTLSMLFKMDGTNYLRNANAYYQTTIMYNGMTVVAFRNNTSGWVGFFKKLSPTDLPEKAQLIISKNFHGCTIQQVSMYINSDGDINYFAQLSGKKSFILKIGADGSVDRFKPK